jgi:hypothetical protein
VKPTFNVHNPLDPNKHIYSGGIRPSNILPKNNLAPTINSPLKPLS